jgi:hypothetical protein
MKDGAVLLGVPAMAGAAHAQTPAPQTQPGDVAWIGPNVRHWHGATPTEGVTHIAAAENQDGTVVNWTGNRRAMPGIAVDPLPGPPRTGAVWPSLMNSPHDHMRRCPAYPRAYLDQDRME